VKAKEKIVMSVPIQAWMLHPKEEDQESI